MPDGENYSQPGRINFNLFNLISESLSELQRHIKFGGNYEPSIMTMLGYHATLQGRYYTSSMKEYNDGIDVIETKYGKNNTRMSVKEHMERLQVILTLLNSIGSFRLRERYPYPEDVPPDDYSIDFLDNYDDNEIDNNDPLLKKLIHFYFDELKKEYEDRSVHLREKESERRAKRAFIFYNRYRQYEQGGFKKSDIEDIFGITPEMQRVLTFWLKELVPSGISTNLFAKMGGGKSNTISFIIQIILILKPEWDILTNVPLIFSPAMYGDRYFPEYKIDRVKFIFNMSQLMMESANSVLNDRIPTVIIDEFDSGLTTNEMRSKGGQNLRDYIYLERHYDTQGPLFIYHARKDIPVPLRTNTLSHAVYMVAYYYNRTARGRTKRVVSNPESWNERMAGGYRYLPIPLTSLPYYNQGTSQITILDVDMQWLNANVKGIKKDAARDILRLIPERGWDEEYQKRLKKEQEREEKARKDQERDDRRFNRRRENPS